jgi:Lrp/AsnC family transcriptional regulator, leucine-responsive regulatory protein
MEASPRRFAQTDRQGATRSCSLDETDLAILHLLRENARTSNAEIARRVGLAPSAIFQRVRKLEEGGVIRGYTALLEPRALGFDLSAFVMIGTNENARAHDTAALLARLPAVREVHRVVGEDCFFVRVQVPDTDALSHVLDDCIRQIPSVASTRTTIILHTAKYEQGPPLPDAARTLCREAS